MQLTGLLCSAMVFSTSFVFAAGNVPEEAKLEGDMTSTAKVNEKSREAKQSTDIQNISLPDVYVDLPQVQVIAENTPTEIVEAPGEPVVEPPVEIQQASIQNLEIEQDLSGTTTLQTRPSEISGTPIDDTPDEPTQDVSNSTQQTSENTSTPESSNESTTNSKTEESSQPESTTLESSTPESSAPESSTPESSELESSAPESSAPESSTPESSAPESSTPESSVPESSIPESSVPESSTPESSVPESSMPESSAPESSTPESSSPSQPTTQKNALERYLEMPSYTPYGKTLSINLNGTTYKADAVVVVAAMLQSEMVGTGSGAEKYYEAYKAQAVACHSYVKHNNNKGIIPSVYARTPSPQTVRLVEQVIGQMVYYNGSIAETLYCASSGLHTQGNQHYWGGTPIPYLQGVESKYDEAPGQKTFTVEQMRSKLNANGYDTSSDPSTWFSNASYSDGNFISRITICGKQVSGMTFHYLLNVKSAKAKISFDGSNFIFTTNGFGHGVGMSQVGAMGYAANDGWNYTQILNHYYPGTSVQ